MLRCLTCGRQYPSNVQFCSADQSPLQVDPTTSAEPTDPLIGKILDEKYLIEEQLGVGGMGKVYRAKHLANDGAVAVKVLQERLIEDEAARMRFRREAKAAGRLTHLNAVAVTDFGQTAEGYAFLVMELLKGRNLREILAKEAPLETARAASLMLQVSSAVAAAHEAGVIHRDLKPANIFVTQSADAPSIVKVLDFGIAKIAAELLEDDEPSTLTKIGTMVGTPRYMSPEQCDGLELTPASDVYSLGVILYEMLTGMVPFSGSSPLAIALKHSSEYPRPPKEIVASIPNELEMVILHALEKDPANRPSNAADFRNELLHETDKLGLEHHALIASADLGALRDVARESPSGRLVVDLSRLREERVLTSGGNEITVVGQPSAESANKEAGRSRQNFEPQTASVEVAHVRRRNARLWLASGLVLVALAFAVIAFITLPANDRRVPVAENSNSIESPSRMPSPLSTPSPVSSPKPSPSPSSDRKRVKIGSLVKVKRILRRPF